jgi:integrase
MSRQAQGPRLVRRIQAGARPLYYVRWTEGGITRKESTGAENLAGAEAFFEDWLAKRRRASGASTGDPTQTRISQVLDDYEAERGPTVASPASLAYAVEPLVFFFAGKTVADLTPGLVQAYWAWRREHSVRTLPDGTMQARDAGASDGTIIRELAGTLRPAIQHAVNMKRLAAGTYHVPVPQAPPGRDYWITRQQAARLVRETRRDKRSRLHLPLYTLIALYCGQRRGAILDLQWCQVDLIAGTIDFNPPGRKQTKKRRPVIPVPPSLLAHLRRAHKRASSPHVIAYNGEPVKDIKTGFNSAAERAGIPDCTSHTLRHTAGTWMAQRGVPFWEIAGYLGHSVQRTSELYAHHTPEHLRKALAAFTSPKRRVGPL